MSQQLVKKGANGRYENVMPRSWIEAIKDKNTGQTLVEILQGFNMYFLPYNGNISATRNMVPNVLRKKGLWITYVKYDGNVYTEWYAADAIDDESWGNSSNWRIGNNTLVGDITISANGNWVINGTETEFKAVGEKGNTPLLRVANNRLQVSYNLGDTYIDVTNNPVYTKFRWLATTEDTQANNVGRIQASTDEGKTWINMSNDFTNNLHIKKYIGINESLPTSGIAEGTIYAKGPYYAEDDTLNDNPIYRLWVYAWKGNTLAWQDNGEFTSIAAGIVQETGDNENAVMSQKATVAAIKVETDRAKEAEQANAQAIAEEKAAIMGTDRIADGAVIYDKLQPEIREVVEGVTYTENPEFLLVKTDSEGHILYAIKPDGTIYYGVGIPPQVQGAINKAVEDLQVDITRIEDLNRITNEHLDDIETRIPQDSDNLEFISIITDKSGNTPLLWINSHGEIDWAKGIPAPLKKYIEEKVSAVNFGSSAYTPSKLSESLFRCSPNCEAQLGMNGIDSDHLVEYATIAKNIGTKIDRVGMYSWSPYNPANPTIDAIRRTYDKTIYKLKKLGYEVMGDFSPYNWFDQRYAYDKTCNTFEKYMTFEIEAIKLFCSRYHNAYYDGADYTSDEDYAKHFISKDEYEKLSYEDKKSFVDMNMKYFESINEWDTNCLGRYGFNWTGSVDEDGNAINDYNVAIANCFKFWKTIHSAIKEVNPDIIHVLGGTTYTCPQIFVDLCDYQEDPEGYRFWEFFDIYNFHSYADSISLYNSTLSLKNLMDRVFDNNKEDNLLDKPVYCTEFGDNTYTSSYEEQAIAMAQKLILLSASGVSSMFPYRLRTFEQDKRNNAWGGTEEDYYGIIHPGVTNSKISWLRNDGSNKAISAGDGLLDMIFLRNDVRLKVTSYVEARLKESGLLIKGAGYTITRVSKIISNVETDIYTTSTVLPEEGGTISLDKSNFQDVKVGDFVVVYADGVDISGNWKGLDPKPAFIALKAFMERFHPDGSSRPVIGYDKEQKCYIASWLDANNKSVHALWSTESKSAKISYTNRNVDVFDYLGNKLIIEDNLISLTSKVTYIIGAGSLTLKF